MVLKVTLIILAVLFGLVMLALAGLYVRPSAFPSFPSPIAQAERWVSIPAGLPAPVERFYKEIAVDGRRFPVIESAVISGRGDLRIGGVTLKGRLRFTHDAGKGYRHYIEVTWVGMPLLKVDEHFLDGRARLKLPGGVVENEAKVDSAAVLGLWAESVMLPSVLLTDTRVRWEPIDQQRARLIVPSGTGEDRFTVTFDPETGLVRYMDAMRWKDAASAEKVGWRCEVLGWRRLDGLLIPTGIAAKWADEAQPWLSAAVEEVVYNADVREYIRSVGP